MPNTWWRKMGYEKDLIEYMEKYIDIKFDKN